MRQTAFLFLLAVALSAFAAEPGPQPRVVPDVTREPAKTEENPPASDVQQTAERIAENAKKAGERLKEKDPGADTRKIQDQIVKDIDALIKKAQEPPPMSNDMDPMMPPPKSDMPPPRDGMPPKGPMPKDGMGGGSDSKSPTGAGNSGGSSQPKTGPGSAGGGRKGRRERKPRGGRPMGMGDTIAKADPSGMKPMPATPEAKGGVKGNAGESGGDKFGKASPKRENDKLAELYKDVWGQLPDRLRQEMDLYYREQFMPRYSELLRQYYSSLAEERKKGSGDR